MVIDVIFIQRELKSVPFYGCMNQLHSIGTKVSSIQSDKKGSFAFLHMFG
jgi:hypothetical protein